MFDTRIAVPKPASPFVAKPSLKPEAPEAAHDHAHHSCSCGGKCAKCAAQKKMAEASGVKSAAPGRGAGAGFNFMNVPVHAAAKARESPAVTATVMAAAPMNAGVSISGGRGGRAGGPLQVSERGDPTEREAESVANRLFPSSRTHSATPAGLPAATRENEQKPGASCTSCGSGAGRLPGGIADKGSPLSPQTRAEMEAAFGTDLSGVRVHTNAGAAQATRDLNAQAFTFGNDIFFDQGKYDPDSVSGKRLLAHELTHTVQQRDSIAMLARDGEKKTRLQCVNENLSSAGVAGWLIAIVGMTCGLVGAIAGSPTGPGAAGTTALAAAACIAGLIGFSVGAVLGVISGCWSDTNFKSKAANLASNAAPGGAAGGAGGAAASPGSAMA